MGRDYPTILRMGGSSGYSYKSIEEKIRFHRSRIEYHKARKAEWEKIAAQIQQLQRAEQLSADESIPTIAVPKRTTEARNRSEYARELLRERTKEGIKPAEVRQLANEQGFALPTNYPYKLFTMLVKKGKARRDESGTYFWKVSDKK